jgi:hypothetical protein
MPITFDIQPQKKLAIAVHAGLVPDAEFLSAYRSLYADARFDISFDLLVDLRRADSSARSTDALRDFAACVSEFYPGADTRPRVAVVATENISFGLARMYEAFSDAVPWDFRVFREVSDALEWLGADGDLLDQKE